jgi:hypothetical protein
MAQKRKPLSEASIQEDFGSQALDQLREQFNLPAVQPSNPLTIKANAEPVS